MASQTSREQKLYDTLKRITQYDQPERIRKLAKSPSGYMGLEADEAIEMAYENVIAERLLDAGIPFVAFDPIGVWRNLKLPGKGKGYEVVVAGDGGDLALTPESAPEIVRAAMSENIPLVIDLYFSAR